MAEHLTRNEKVVGSIPTTSSIIRIPVISMVTGFFFVFQLVFGTFLSQNIEISNAKK